MTDVLCGLQCYLVLHDKGKIKPDAEIPQTLPDSPVDFSVVPGSNKGQTVLPAGN